MRNWFKENSWRSIVGISMLCLLCSAVVAFVQPQAESEQVRLYLANLFQCLILMAMALPCIRAAYGWLREIGYTKRDMLWICFWSAVLSAFVLVFMYLFFRDEKDIKVYDFSQYWIQVLDYRKVIPESIPNYLQRLLGTLSNEYTALPAFALQPASYLFGTSFTGYTQSVFVMYYLPAAFFLTILAKRLVHGFRPDTPRVTTFITCLSVCVLTPILLNTLMLGYLDVVGVVVIALMLNIVLRWDGRSFSIQRSLILALLSVTLLLLRRWYAYYIVGFYFAIGIMVLVDAVANKEKILESIGKVLINLAMIALVSAVLIFFLNRDVFAAFLGNDYGEAYSAYKVVDSLYDLVLIVWDTGYLGILAAIAGFGILVYHKASRSAGLRMLIAIAVAAVLFLRVQSLGTHHRYLLTPTLLVFIMVCICFLLQNLTRTREGVASSGLLLFCCMNMAIAFVPGNNTLAQVVRIAGTSLRSYPVQNQYYDTYWQILSELDIKTDRKAASVYMLGENQVGPEYLRRIDLPNRTDAAPFLITNSIVDLRDGFPSQMFFADYVLVPDPLVNTLSDVQQISYQIYDMFLNDPQIAEYYTLETVYEMDAKTVINLFRKTGDADRALVDSLKARLQSYYPDTPFVYEPVYFLSLASFDESMVYYNFYANELSFAADPQEIATFAIHDTGTFSELSFAMRVNAPGYDLVIENQDGELYRMGINTVDTDIRVEIADSAYLRVQIVPQAGTDYQSGVVLYYQEDSLR